MTDKTRTTLLAALSLSKLTVEQLIASVDQPATIAELAQRIEDFDAARAELQPERSPDHRARWIAGWIAWVKWDCDGNYDSGSPELAGWQAAALDNDHSGMRPASSDAAEAYRCAFPSWSERIKTQREREQKWVTLREPSDRAKWVEQKWVALRDPNSASPEKFVSTVPEYCDDIPYPKLTTMETIALAALIRSAESNGHDFGFTSAAMINAQSDRIVFRLAEKGLINIEESVNGSTQFTWGSGSLDDDQRELHVEMMRWLVSALPAAS